MLRVVLAHYKFASLGELNAILAHYHLTAEEVKTEVRGKRYDGLVYLLTDDEGKKESMPIAASELGRGLGHTAITNHIKRSKFALKTDIPKVRQRVLMAMRTSPSSEIDLKKSLIQQGLRVVLRRNKVGRIYGITFIDDKEGIALNGSRLGKGYSANVFCPISARHRSKILSWMKDIIPTAFGKVLKEEEKQGTFLKKSSHVFPEKSHVSHDNSESDNLIDELLDDTLDTLAAPAGNDDGKKRLGNANCADRVRFVWEEESTSSKGIIIEFKHHSNKHIPLWHKKTIYEHWERLWTLCEAYPYSFSSSTAIGFVIAHLKRGTSRWL